MKKKSLWLTFLSVVAALSLAIPVFAAFAESGGSEPAAAQETITVDIFNGNNAGELDFTNGQGAETATVTDDNGVTAISISNKWSGFILLKDTIDLTKAKAGQLCFEYKTIGEGSWAKISAVTFANSWKEPVSLNGSGDTVGLASEYAVKRYDLSSLTDAQLAKFKGFAIGTSGTFLFKRVWVEYTIKNEDVKVTGYDIFTGITEAGEPAPNSAGTAWTATYTAGISGKIVSDGTALAFGQFEGGAYYATGTNAKTATRATIAQTDITSALLGGGMLNFKAKFDFASEDGRYAKLRIFYECGQWGESAFVEVPLTDYVAGEWKDYSIALTALNLEVSAKSTFGNSVSEKWFDWTKFVGIGLSVGSAGEGDNAVSFADVKISGVNEKGIKGIEALGAITEYSSGDNFDTTGMTVNVVLEDETKVEVKNYKVAPEQLGADTEVVTVSWIYNGTTYTADINVTVTAEYSSIKVKTNPTRTAYKSGEKFEKDGMVVVAVKADGSETEITDYTYYTGVLYSGTTSVGIEYLGLKTNVEITVSDFEHSLSLTENVFAADGEPKYGWQAKVASALLTSEAKYNAATDEEKANLIATPKDDEKGYYITAKFDSNNYATRVFEYGVADYRLLDVYDEVDYNGTVSVTYRTSSVFDKAVNFGLANFMDWNLGYHNADISSYIVSDGEWHTLYFDIALCFGEINGMLWGGISGDVDFNKIVGFAVQSQADGSLDIADVSIKWNGPADAARAVDTTAPEYTYGGDMTIEAAAGDSAPDFSSEKAYDKNDGEVQVIVKWSEGALTEDGKLNEGNHTVELYAVDAAGNKCEAYVINVTVTGSETPGESASETESGSEGSSLSPDESTDGSGSVNPAPTKKGCFGAVNTISVSAVALLIAGAFVIANEKKDN